MKIRKNLLFTVIKNLIDYFQNIYSVTCSNCFSFLYISFQLSIFKVIFMQFIDFFLIKFVWRFNLNKLLLYISDC